MKRLITSILAIGAMLLCAAPALAFECDRVINDDAGVFGGNTASITAAANELQSLGAVVRVFTVKDYGNAGSLDRYEASLEKQCPSWQDNMGGVRGNLFVLSLELEHREIAVNHGDKWVSAFESNNGDTKVQNAMMSDLKTGDFVAAFVNGLKEAKRYINAAVSAPINNGGGNTTVINQAPQDFSGFISLLFWIFGAVVVALAALFGIRFFNQWRSENEAKRVAQLDAQTAKTQVANLINGFDTSVLTARVNKVAALVDAAEATSLKQELAAIERDHASFSAKFSGLGEVANMDPSTLGLTASEYEAIGERYAALLQGGIAIDTRMKNLDSAAREIEQAAQVSPQLVTEAGDAISTSLRGIGDVASTGFKPKEAQAVLDQAKELHAQATEHLNAGRLGSAGTTARNATQKAQEALTLAQALPETKKSIDLRLGVVTERLQGAHTRAGQVKKVFDAMEQEFAPVLWKTVAGNGTEAQKRIAAAEDVLDEALKNASMSSQEWESASVNSAKANTLLDEAEQLFASIISLQDRVMKAKAKARPEIEAAAVDIEKARVYLRTYDADIDDKLEGDLERADELLTQAKAALKQDKPNYIAVVKTALAANSAADSILAEAQSEHETMERLRRQTDSTLQEAKRSIGEADRYISNHSSDVNGGARRALKEAETLYEQAVRTDSLKRRLELAQNADQSADLALKKAEDDVEEEEERIRRRRQQDARNTGIAIGVGSSSRRSDTWGSPGTHHGSSNSFGSPGGHHGSSISFSSPGGHHGSSAKW